MEEDEADEGHFFRLRLETRRVPGLSDAVHLLDIYLFIFDVGWGEGSKVCFSSYISDRALPRWIVRPRAGTRSRFTHVV